MNRNGGSVCLSSLTSDWQLIHLLLRVVQSSPLRWRISRSDTDSPASSSLLCFILLCSILLFMLFCFNLVAPSFPDQLIRLDPGSDRALFGCTFLINCNQAVFHLTRLTDPNTRAIFNCVCVLMWDTYCPNLFTFTYSYLVLVWSFIYCAVGDGRVPSTPRVPCIAAFRWFCLFVCVSRHSFICF